MFYPLSPAQHEVQHSRLLYCLPWSGSGREKCVFSTQQFLSAPPSPSHCSTAASMNCTPSGTACIAFFHHLIQVFPKVPPPWLQSPVMACGGASGAGWNGLCLATPHKRLLQRLGTCTWYSQKYQNLQTLKPEGTRKRVSLFQKSIIFITHFTQICSGLTRSLHLLGQEKIA